MNSSLLLHHNIVYDSKYDMCSDNELIEKIHDGNEQAEKCLVKRYYCTVTKIISSFYIMGCVKDDLLQESMIGLFKAIRSYDPRYGKSFKRYAELCIKRQIISALRKYNMCIESLANNSDDEEEMLLEQISDDSLTPEDILLVKEEKDIFNKFKCFHLSEYEKTVISKYCEGKSYKEIAEALNKDLKSIDNALQRVKKKANIFSLKCFKKILKNTE
ncbi:MAG TPA: sigma-70 family RNA polymerase sigma factor [Tissierellia bacterium]|nr:sigma-70 family RNA polymerase sigma factor [Tissierellia bacterium]